MLTNCRLQIREFSSKLQTTADPLKSPKKIQNDQIQSISSQALSLFDNYMTHSEKQKESLRGRIEMCSDLSNSLKMVAARVNNQKGFLARVSSNFFYHSPEEKDFDKTLNKITIQLKKTKREYTQLSGSNPLTRLAMRLIKAYISRALTAMELNPETKLTESYFRIVGNTKMISTVLEGTKGSSSLADFKKDLEKFVVLYFEHLNSTDKKNLDRVMQQLDQSFVISQCFEKHFYEINIRSKESLTAICSETMYDVIKEIEKLQSGESTAFPGGFTGHALMYKVRREKDNTYSFLVINTGSGWDAFQNIFKEKMGELAPDKVIDYELLNLSIEEVTNPEFLTKLALAKIVQDSSPNGVQAIVRPITDHLINGTKVKFQAGLEHTKQVNGTCTYSRIEAWLETELDQPLLKSIFQFMNKQGLENITRLKEEGINFQSIQAETNGEKLQGIAVLDRLMKIGKKNAEVHEKEYQSQLKKLELSLAEAQGTLDFLTHKYGFVQQQLSRAEFNKKVDLCKVAYYRLSDPESALSDEEICKIPENEMLPPPTTLFSRIESLFQTSNIQQAWINYQESIANFHHCKECVKKQYKVKLLTEEVNRLRQFSPVLEACTAA